MDLSNFNKTEYLIGRQTLNKNLSNSKKQKTTSIQLTENTFFFP